MKIYYVGKSILEVYIPSIGRGHNIVKAINEAEQNIILEVSETNSEVIFKLKDKDLDKIITYLKPQTSGSDISPFSKRNLPKRKTTEQLIQKGVLTKEQISEYESISAMVHKDDILMISHLNKQFLRNVVCKKRTNNLNMCRAEMKKELLSLRDYFFFKGYGEQYLKFLRKEIENKYGKGGR